VRLLWSKSSNPLDWLILLMTGQDCAHFSFSFQDVNGQEVVFETNLLGGHPAFYPTWINTSSRQIIHSQTVDVPASEVTALWQSWVQNYDGKSYDFLGALYTGLMTLRLRLFKIPKPLKNAWSQRNTYYCDEIYQLVSGRFGFPVITNMSNGMDTPHDVWMKLQVSA
jgi:hypothetical protein